MILALLFCTAATAQASLYGFVTQQTSNYSFTNATSGEPSVSSSTEAEQTAIPSGSEVQNGSFDPLQSYVGPALGRPAENFFGRKGLATPDYSRADSLTSVPLTPRNVAELFLTNAGTANASSTSVVSLPLTVLTPGPVTITMNVSNWLVLQHSGTVSGVVQVSHGFELNIDQSGNTVFSVEPGSLNRLATLKAFGSDELIVSGQVSLTTSALEPGDYTATFSSMETVFADLVPEPAHVGLFLALGAVLRRHRPTP